TLYTSTGVAQTIMALAPVFIFLPAYLLFNQKITALEIIGAVVSVIGVSLFFI
ncbi:MAG: EamA family transporter, partial [Bacteroidaceae bacterium]|nr:EamA family transporter [Bacteroidaceae bacterium]